MNHIKSGVVHDYRVNNKRRWTTNELLDHIKSGVVHEIIIMKKEDELLMNY